MDAQNDLLVEVEGEDVTGMPLADVKRRIAGPVSVAA
jgi:hypothetical protein